MDTSTLNEETKEALYSLIRAYKQAKGFGDEAMDGDAVDTFIKEIEEETNINEGNI